jgi:16S rRNA C1402 N4-methylase RsmH
VAKVMPPEPEKVEITTETLKEALSDIYFDYDRFSIREDAVSRMKANAVKTFLEDLGISSDKLQVVSYGKERPFCKEQTEECWQENRRGHFVIK